MRRLGIGALLGLHPDWRAEAHRASPCTRAPSCGGGGAATSPSRSRVCGPRRAATSPRDPVGDREFVQLLCALRLLLPDVGHLALDARGARVPRRARAASA